MDVLREIKLLGLNKKRRLNQAANFKNAFKKGKKLAGHFFSLYIFPNELNYPRLGIVSSKKAIPLAVKRNQFKRVVRESFRQKQHLFPGIDIVVVAHVGVGKQNKAELKANLENLWPKLARSC